MSDVGDLIDVGSTLSCKTCFGEVVTGEVAAFNKPTKFLILKHSIPGHPPSFVNVTFLNLNFVKDFEVIKEVIGPKEVTLQNMDVKLVEKRRDREIEKKKRLIEAIRANVSDSGRGLFTHICKTIEDVQWNGTSIVVMKDISIHAPYNTECVISASDNKQSVQYICKIVEKFFRGKADSPTSGSSTK